MAFDGLGRKWCNGDSGCCIKSAGRLSGDSGRDASGGPRDVSRARDAVWDVLGSVGGIVRCLGEMTGTIPCTQLGDLQSQQGIAFGSKCRNVNVRHMHCDWAYSTFLDRSDFRDTCPRMHSSLFAEPVNLQLSS